MENPTLHIYGCGGCGINLARRFTPIENPGYIKVTKSYLDNSHANVTEADVENTFVVPGMSGAGKDRTVAFKAVHDQITTILKTFKPGDVNVIISSASGGSGSVISPLLAAELARRNIPTVTIIVGSTVSEKETDNTLKTLATFQQLSIKVVKQPIAISYYENCTDRESKNPKINTRTNIDASIHEELRRITFVVSEQHRELDRQDFANFLYYTNVSNVPVQLVDLVITTSSDRLEGLDKKVISTVSLLTDESNPEPSMGQLYSATGYISEDVLKASSDIPNFYLMLTGALRTSRIERLKVLNDAFVAQTEAFSSSRHEDLSDIGTSDESGMVF